MIGAFDSFLSASYICLCCTFHYCYNRGVGSDIAKGEKILQAGICLGPAEIGVLATVGVTSVTCYRKPSVGIMSTGTEVRYACYVSIF